MTKHTNVLMFFFVLMIMSSLCQAASRSSSIKIHISAYVPPRCEIKLSDTRLVNNRWIIRTDEKCNTQRDLKIMQKHQFVNHDRHVSYENNTVEYNVSASNPHEPYFLVVQSR